MAERALDETRFTSFDRMTGFVGSPSSQKNRLGAILLMIHSRNRTMAHALGGS